MENTIDLSTNGPFLHSDVTIESPEFQRKPPSLQLSCRSSLLGAIHSDYLNDLILVMHHAHVGCILNDGELRVVVDATTSELM
ncbi:hypothetical protein TSMEX_009125 [Taenia solium]|eukprot:TsM_000952200 transcript=TsM_000952200 gene=TsM_000952200